MEGRPCLHRLRGQAHVAVAIALRRERECVALLAVRVGVRPLAGVGRVGGAGGDVADRDALVREVVQQVAVLIHRLAGPCSRADVDGRRAARAVLVWDVEDGQPVAFEGPIAATGSCARVCGVRIPACRCWRAGRYVRVCDSALVSPPVLPGVWRTAI